MVNEENICEGFGCSKKATNCIEVIGAKKGSIILYLCDSCAKLFDDPLCNTDKKTSEQRVVGPRCSNASLTAKQIIRGIIE
jgi:hypothetical protein